jgi:HTH-type transcriptional regulator, sugar sensing transcriptional regulator
MNYKESLMGVGLTSNEAEMYLLLLEIGESLASTLAKKTKISRPHVYDSLNKLLEKGMASYIIRNGKRYFRSAPPEKIIDYVKEQQYELEQKEAKIKQIIPNLNSSLKKVKNKPKIDVYDGPEGLKTILFDIASVGKEMLAFNTIGDKILDYLPMHVIKRYYEERRKKRVKSRQFYSEGVKLLKHSMATYKKLPSEYNPVLLFVYGNNVSMFILTDDPITIKIESEEVANLYRIQFEYMWKMIK